MCTYGLSRISLRLGSAAAVLILGTIGLSAVGQSNVVFIIADDAGWADFGFLRDATADADPGNAGAIPTPNLDTLASTGVSFSNAYAGSVCAPSRAMLVSGQYGGRFGYHQNMTSNNTQPIDQVAISQGVPASVNTIWERMQAQGYTTAALGKWHLGEHSSGGGLTGNLPELQGVEYFEGLHGGSRGYFAGSATGSQALVRTISDGAGNVASDQVVEGDFAGQYVTDIIGDRSANYIRDHANAADPFFLYSSFTAPHTPLQATAADLATVDSWNDPAFTGNRRTYAAMQLALDRNVGKILDQLHDPNGDGDFSDSVRDDTMIMFINDNGGDNSDSTPNGSDNGVLRQGKGSQYEGGLRVPFIIAGAGVDAAVRGTTSTQLAHIADVLPTMVEGAAGGSLLPGEVIDGVNLLPHLNGTATGVAHEDLFLQRYANQQSAVRQGDWKYMFRNGTPQLYDLATDPGESNNVLAANPAKGEELKLLMTSYIVQMDKARVDNVANSTNQFDGFRLLTDGDTTVSFSQADVWRDADAGSGRATMSWRDGFADAQLIFETRDGGGYTATNDLQSVGGVALITNRISLRDTGGALTGSHSGVINGAPMMLTNARDGSPAKVELSAADPVAGRFTFEVDTDLELYDTTEFGGDGNQQFAFGGEIRSLRPGVGLTKTGASTMTLRGSYNVAGGVNVQGGALELAEGTHTGSLTNRGTVRLLENIDETSTPRAPLAGLVANDVELSFDAGDDLLGDAVWTDQQGRNNLLLSNTPSLVSVNDAVFSGLNSAYDRPRGGGETTTFFEAAPAGQSGNARSRRDGTFEVVFKVDDLSGGDDQIVLDVGGSGRGVNLSLRGDQLTAAVRGDSITQSISTLITTGWHHAVIAIDLNNPDNANNDQWSLYLDNAKVDDSPLVEIDDWSGGNSWGLGNLFSSTPAALPSFSPVAFDGQVALARYYADLAFGDAEVQQNFDVLTTDSSPPPPGSLRPTVMIEGDFTQTAAGTLGMVLAASDDHDKLVVTGQLNAGGALVVATDAAFEADLGDEFDLFDFDSATGSFGSFSLPGLAAGLSWDTGSLLTDGILRVVQQVSLIGDYDGDGFVSQSDLDLVLLNWGQDTATQGVPAGWTNDLPEGLIGQEELDGVLLNWGAGTPTSLNLIPEPASTWGVVLGFLANGRWGRR